MTVISSFLLGLIQGVAEFLPISSSGHLAIAKNLLGMNTEIPDFFDIMLHMGTLLAVFVAYWRDIVKMVVEFFRGVGDIIHQSTPQMVPPARRLIFLLIFGSLPMFAVLPVHKFIRTLSDNTIFVGMALVVTGFLLFACDLVRKGNKNEMTAGVWDVVLVGFTQVIATLPGVSRSGMTIASGCFVGFDRQFAVRYSFLLSVPSIIAANGLTLVETMKTGIDTSQMGVYMVGVVTAAVTGYLCICLLRTIARKGHFGVFAYYCWGVGLLTLLLNMIL